MKKLVAIAVAAFASLLMVGAAQAANESVTASTKVTPKGGSLYQEAPKPAELEIRADVVVPPSEIKVTPMKNTKLTFPKGLSLNPNDKLTPPCTDAKLSASSTFLANPGQVLEACKKSVVGTGTADIFLGAFRVAVKPAILIIFNEGKSSSGSAKVKIYGYAASTNVGIIMKGELRGEVLDVAIPVLSSDSAVKYFQFNLPGGKLDIPSDLSALQGKDIRGLDPNYVKAVCPASGELVTNAEFKLGTRDVSTGNDTGPTITANAPETTQPCTGLKGSPKLKGKVKSPRAVKNGRKGAFKVTISNPGTATAKAVKVSATGGGKANAGNIAPGKKKTVTVRTTVRGKKGKKAAVKFTIKGAGASAKATARVTVK